MTEHLSSIPARSRFDRGRFALGESTDDATFGSALSDARTG
jgi:hypothetical protein